MLTFLIPVRHQNTVKDWGGVKERMKATIRSIKSQTEGCWEGIIIANEGAELPDLPSTLKVLRVNFEPNILPRSGTAEHFYQSVRHDKGCRILAGLVHYRPKGHVMVVDYDDLISRRLAGFVSENRTGNGWYFDTGYLLSEDEIVEYPSKFDELCGTSSIIRSDLLSIPESFEAASPEYICRWLGSHKFLKSDLAKAGNPLEKLPIEGAIYRIGHADTTSRSKDILNFIAKKYKDNNDLKELMISKIRKVDQVMLHEFFGNFL